MPEAAPVMAATLFLKSFILSLSGGVGVLILLWQ